MHAFVRNSLLGALLLASASTAFADTTGVNLPAPPRGSGGEDSIETAGGSRCRQSINSNGAYVDFGAVGVAQQPLDYDSNDTFRFYSDERDKSGMVYARVTIPLGKRPERIDCSQLYQLEIARLREEVELLKMSAE